MSFSLPHRFWNKVEKASSCWNWTASRVPFGYGKFRWNGRLCTAHRLVMQSLGYRVEGLVVRHRCDNPSCVNPKHLIVGTQRDNVLDMFKKGRCPPHGVKGSTNKKAKFSDAQILSMRKEWAAIRRTRCGQVPPGMRKAFMSKFGISSGHLARVITMKRWAHI